MIANIEAFLIAITILTLTPGLDTALVIEMPPWRSERCIAASLAPVLVCLFTPLVRCGHFGNFSPVSAVI